MKMKSAWKDNSIQFPRLLAELWACGLDSGVYDNLEASMNLSRKRIYELFERAEKEWERIKRTTT